MKKYPYLFTKTIKTLLYVLVALCVVCVLYTGYRAVTHFLVDHDFDFYQILNRTIPILVGIFGFVVSVSMLKESCYEIADNKLITRFGILSSSYDIKDIEKIQLFQKTKKLTLFFRDGKYTVIVVKEEWYRDFIDELLKRNKGIFYSDSAEE